MKRTFGLVRVRQSAFAGGKDHRSMASKKGLERGWVSFQDEPVE